MTATPGLSYNSDHNNDHINDRNNDTNDDHNDDDEFRRGSFREYSRFSWEQSGGASASAGAGAGAPVTRTCRGRGVVMATRGGKPLLLDTHPIHAPPSPPPPPQQPPPIELPPPTDAASVTRLSAPSSVVARPFVRGAVSVLPSSGAHGKPTGKRRRSERDGSFSSPPLDGNAFDGGSSSGRGVGLFTAVVLKDDAGVASGGVSMGGGLGLGGRRQKTGGLGVEAAAATLGGMCKRGFLVRAMRRFCSLSIIGVRFAKAATWCNNCGLVSGKKTCAPPPSPLCLSRPAFWEDGKPFWSF